MLKEVRERLVRIEKTLESQSRDRDRPVVGSAYSISQAARSISVSESFMRRVILKRELPASNVGSAARPLWRITQSDLIAWLESKKGGDPKIPPRSDLKALIDRHLPGLRGRKDSATR
jgi:excisionase family DNA binding protein